MFSQLRAVIPATAALMAVALVLVAPVAWAEEGGSHESAAQYQSQLSGGQIQSVAVNKRTHTLQITLKNGEHFRFKFAKKHVPKELTEKYIDELKAKGVAVHVLSAAEAEQEHGSPHHKLRYIAGGVLIAVLVIAAVILLVRRRRPDED